MTEHYFNENPMVEHDEKMIKAVFFDKEFNFKTDAGVFSKNGVDYGTSLLISDFGVTDESKILDLGCGYGPIGIVTAARLLKGQVVFADINERAVDLTKYNLVLNKHLINNDVKVQVIKTQNFINIKEKQFDYILLNPPIRAGKETVYKLFNDSWRHLKEKGELWIVIQKKQGALSAIKKLKTIFSAVNEVQRKKGYYIVKSVK